MNPREWTELKFLAREVMREREMEVSACSGKVKYQTRSEAMLAIRPHKRGMVAAYRCPVCHHWHCGQKLRLKRLAEERQRCESR